VRADDVVLVPPALHTTNAESREDSVRRDLTRRLKRICEKLSSADFEALLVKMTREQLRGEGTPPPKAPPR
jgi:hypothetical protein